MLGKWLRFWEARKEVRRRRPAPSLELLEDRVVPRLFVVGDVQLLGITHGPATATAGTAETFVVRVRNNGPMTVHSVNLKEQFSQALSGLSFTPGSGTYVAATGNWTGLTLTPGAVASLTVRGTLASTARGTLSTTARLAAVPGIYDYNAANNAFTDHVGIGARADLSITKGDNKTNHQATPGQPVVYTVVVHNAGPSAVTGARVTDVLPADLTGATWSAAAPAGASVADPSGTGNIDTTVNLLPGTSVTFTITATVSASFTGSLANTAAVAAPAGVTDPNAANNSATDTLTVPPTGDLSITKTDDAGADHTAVPGTQVVYTVVVSNAGPSTITAAPVTDVLPVGLTGATWTATAAGGGSVADASGSGNVNTTVDLPSGATVTFVITATIDPAATASLANTAAVAAPSGSVDPNTANNTATDTLTLTPKADLSVTKTDNSDPAGSAVPGTSVVYTVVVSNTGPSAVTAAQVADAVPAGIKDGTWSWGAVPSSGASVTNASGSGDINTTVNLAPGSTVTFTITAEIDPAATGTVVNTAAVTAPGGVTDPDTSNNSATDTLTLVPTADLLVTKTDDVNGVLTPGGTVVYTMVVSNVGPSAVRGASVTDTQPEGIASASWTATPSSGASVANPSGNGNIATTVDLAPGASVTFTITASVDPGATAPVTNTGIIGVPVGVTDPNPGNNQASDTLS